MEFSLLHSDNHFVQWEKEAREARKGLWSADNPQKPWEWKRDHPRKQNNKKVSANDIQVC
jgi:endonuclease YncB( thermonuclease family)